MLSLSTADGFMSVKEGVDDMIKYLANEPSVGLYFVQQHAQASMPYLLDVKEQVVQKIHDVSLHTEDVEDSIDVVRSMTEFGYPIADEMIKDISKSLHIISKFQPKRGLIQSTTTWGHQTGISSSNVSVLTLNSGNNSGHRDSPDGRGYFSTVLNSAKQKAAGLRRINQQSTVDRLIQSSSQSPFASGPSVPSHAEVDDLPVSSSLAIGETLMELGEDPGSYDRKLYQLQDYSKFNEDKEANFETWLQESEEQYRFLKHDD